MARIGLRADRYLKLILIFGRLILRFLISLRMFARAKP